MEAKKIAIMQPYIFPYIGYWQLINAVDEFVIYDNIQYTKKGWINRNRILLNNKDIFISIPLKKDSDYLTVKDRYLSDSWIKERKKVLNKIKEGYRKAPYFDEIFILLEKIINYQEKNLFKFILNSQILIKDFLEIKTKFVISSSIDINHQLKNKDKVLEICRNRKASVYINPIGGLDLYDKEEFKEKDIKLQFLKSSKIEYRQFNNEFIPWLSIIDVLMFNSKDKIQDYLKLYTIL